MNEDAIGVLDSGVGGLTITKELIKLLPEESVCYISDSLNTPYGSKNSEEIYLLSEKLIRFLIAKKVKLIVIACNTITVSCIERLRIAFPLMPIVGTVPIIKKAVIESKNKRVGILSTMRTARSEYLQTLINTYGQGCFIINRGNDSLVPLIENNEADEEKITRVIKTVLRPFHEMQIDTLALGCTHFPLLREQIENEMGKYVLVLDSGAAIARQVARILDHNAIRTTNKEPVYDFYSTGENSIMNTYIKKYLKLNNYNIEKITL